MLRYFGIAPFVPALFALAALYAKREPFVRLARAGAQRPWRAIGLGGVAVAGATALLMACVWALWPGAGPGGTWLEASNVIASNIISTAILAVLAAASGLGMMCAAAAAGVDPERHPYRALGAGFVALAVATAVPKIGGAAQFLCVAWGAGAAIVDRGAGKRAAAALVLSCAALLPARADAVERRELKKDLKTIARAHQDPGDRVAAVSALFLGTPYRWGPLGEGPNGEFDRDPLVRYDLFDCTTFVETSLALGLEPDVSKGEKLLQKIRYKDGVIDYAHRNHFAAVDWIPNNEKAGFIRDITRELAGSRTRTATKTISKRAWYAAKTEKDLDGPFTAAEKPAVLARFRQLGKDLPDDQARLDYVPFGDLPETLPRVPNGSIASLVRADDPKKIVLVSHQVLIVDQNGVKYVRHAAFGKDVREGPALQYFQQYAGSSWPLLGLHIDAPQVK